MKKLLLLTKTLLAAALLCVGQNAWGQKANLTTDKGWSLMTDIPANPNLYFFAIYDHAQDLGLVLGNGTSEKQGDSNKAMLYASSVNPETNKNALWTIAKNGDDIVFTCANYPEYMFQTEWQAYAKFHTSDNGGSFLFWGSLIPTYDAESGWTFASRHATDESQTDKYLGPWDGTVVAGDQIAANKGTSNLGHFDIYMIERGRYFQNVSGVSAGGSTVDASYLITNANATRRNIVGWEGAAFYVRDDQAAWANNTYCFAIHADGPIPDNTFYQTISNLPAGRYTLTVTVPDWANSHSGAKLHANTAEIDMANEDNKLLSNTFDHAGGSLEYGIHIQNSSSELTFFPFDNFTLTAHYISDYAENLSIGSNDLTANKWYKLVVAEGKSFSISASVSISDISYTTVDQLEGANISVNTASSETRLTAGTYYIKSSSAQTIKICVPVTISSYGYATFSSTSPVNVNVTGLEAYIATGKSGDYVIMEKVTGNVDANTGLVLKGAAGTDSLPIVGSGTSYSATNRLFVLDGSYSELGSSKTGTNYVLSVQSENVVWAPINTDKAPVTAGHAALYLDGGGARAMIMSFGDDITGVENVEAAPAEAKAKDGKFIENGKLVIVKNGVKYNAAGAKLY